VDPEKDPTGNGRDYTTDDPGLAWEGLIEGAGDLGKAIDQDLGGADGSALPPANSGCPTAPGEDQSGDATSGPGGGVTFTDVDTPYGPASQENTPEALALRDAVKGGAPIYRMGTMGKSETAEGQFWSPNNPLDTPDYAEQNGIPADNMSGPDFVESGTVPSGSNIVTRGAPAFGSNPGGALEVVTSPGGVTMTWFHQF